MSRKWIQIPHIEGQASRQAHADLPPGTVERELKRVKSGRLYLIPASDETRGHGTTALARFWKQQLQELLQSAPRL